MAGEDQNIAIGVDASKAVSELSAFESSIAKQSAQLSKIIGVMQKYNSAGELTDKVITSQVESGKLLTLEYKSIDGQLVKTSENLRRAGGEFANYGAKVEKAVGSQREFTNAQASVTAALGQRFSQLPTDSTQSSIDALEREKNRLAKLVAGQPIKGGAVNFIAEAIKKAEAGIFSDRKGLAGNIERQIFNIIEARARVDATSAKTQERLRQAAQATLPVLSAEEQALLQIAQAAKQAAAEQEQARIAAKRASDAQGARELLQERVGFKPTRPNRNQFRAIEQSFTKIQQSILSGELDGQRLIDLFEDIQGKKQLAFNSKAEFQAVTALRSLIGEQERYNAELDKAKAKLNALRQARATTNQTRTRAQASAVDLTQLIRDDLGIDVNLLKKEQAAKFGSDLATIQASIAGSGISASRVLDMYTQIQAKQIPVFAGPKDKSIFSTLNALIRMQEQYNAILKKNQTPAAAPNAGPALDTLRKNFAIDPSKLKTDQAARASTAFASIEAAITSGGTSAARVLQLYDQIITKQKVAFASPKDRGVVSALTQLVAIQQRYTSEIAKSQTAAEKLARIRTGEKLQASLVNRFGGVPANATQAQVQRIQAASTAIANLVKNTNISKAQFASTLAAFEADANVHFTGIEGKAVNTFRSLQNAIDDVKTPFEQIMDTLKRFGLSWTGVLRIFAAQIIFSAVARVISGLQQAVQAASEFSIKIAEIRTLTEGNAVSASTWSKSLRDVSDEFGIPLLDTAAAAYDVLSNQVAKGTNAINFLKEAAVFSKITVSSLQDSVNLLSGAVNAYRNQGLTAQRASEILFSTIDLGKVRVEEIADTFGNVAILSAQLGVSFEELNAIFSAITIQGTRADTAMTLLNNLMLKMLKPTGEIRTLMDEWGVSTGKQAFQTFGALGVLQKFNKAITDGKIALEDANETRAIRAFAASASNSGLDIVQENIQKQKAAAENKKRAEEIARQAPGALFQRQLVQFSNFLTQDVGTPIFETLVKISQGFGDIKNVLATLTQAFQGPISVVLNFATAVSSVLSLFGKLPGGTTAVNGALTALGATMSGLLTAFVAYKAAALVMVLANSGLGRQFIAFGQLVLQQVGTSGKLRTAWRLLRDEGSALGNTAGATAGKLGLIALAAAFVIGALSSVAASAASARTELTRFYKEQRDQTSQSLFNAQVTGFDKLTAANKAQLEERNRATLQSIAVLRANLNQSVVEVTENVKRQRALIGNAGFHGEISLDFLINGKEGNAENDLKVIADGIRKSIDEAFKLERQLNNIKFDNALSGADAFGSTELVFKRIESLQEKISGLFDERNMQGLRDTFKDIGDLIKEQLVGREGLDGLIEKTREQLELLKTGNSPKSKRAAGKAAEEKGLKLLDLGNIQEAQKEFDKADKIFSDLASKQKNFSKDLRKLGVKLPDATGNDQGRLQARLEALQKTKASPANPEKKLEDLVAQQLALEKRFQENQTQTLVDQNSKLKALDAQFNSATAITEALEEQNLQLKKNLETHNEITTSLNEQVGIITQSITTLQNQAGSGFGFLPADLIDSFVLKQVLGIKELAKLQEEIQAQRENLDAKSKAFEANQNADTFAQFDAALRKRQESLQQLSDALVKRQETIKGLEGGESTPEAKVTSEAFRKLKELMEQEKKQADELRQRQQDLITPKTSSLDATLQKSSFETFGLRGTQALQGLSAELTTIINQVNELNNDLASPTLLPTQLGQRRFATQITNVQAPAVAATARETGVTVQGDIVVQIQEVVDGKIDPVVLGRALQRALRQQIIS